MAKADYDGDGDKYCVVGGEMTTPGPVCPNDWVPSSKGPKAEQGFTSLGKLDMNDLHTAREGTRGK